jgi:hypothetical protein
VSIPADTRDRLVRLEEAAAMMGVPTDALRSARKRGTLILPIVKIGPRVLTVRQSDIDAVIAGEKMVFESRKAAAKRLIKAEGE